MDQDYPVCTAASNPALTAKHVEPTPLSQGVEGVLPEIVSPQQRAAEQVPSHPGGLESN
jgi:hypothetical protein